MASQQLQNILSALQQQQRGKSDPAGSSNGVSRQGPAQASSAPLQNVQQRPMTTMNASLTKVAQLVSRQQPAGSRPSPTAAPQQQQQNGPRMNNEMPNGGVANNLKALLRSLPQQQAQQQQQQIQQQQAQQQQMPYMNAAPQAVDQRGLSSMMQQPSQWNMSAVPPPPDYAPRQSNNASTNVPQHIASLPPSVVCVGILDSPMIPGEWQLDEGDLKRLLSCFGQLEWLRVLCSPVGPGRVPDCCVAKFYDSSLCALVEKELDGVFLPDVGRLSVAAFPQSTLDGVAGEATLAALVCSKLQAKALGGAAAAALNSAMPPSVNAQQQAPPPVGGEKIANALAAALCVISRTPDGPGLSQALMEVTSASPEARETVLALLDTDVGRNAVAAVRADPSLLNALQTQLQSLLSSTSSSDGQNVKQPQFYQENYIPPKTTYALRQQQTNAASAEAPTASAPAAAAASALPPRKRVCRLELIDLFGSHPEFDVASLIVGENNSNMQYVLEESHQRVDIDLDGVPCNGAPVAERLHLAVTSLDKAAYDIAVETLEDLLHSICRRYVEFCTAKKLLPLPPNIGFRRHEYIEGPDGQLIYLGHKDPGRPWLSSGGVGGGEQPVMQQQQQQQHPQRAVAVPY